MVLPYILFYAATFISGMPTLAAITVTVCGHGIPSGFLNEDQIRNEKYLLLSATLQFLLDDMRVGRIA